MAVRVRSLLVTSLVLNVALASMLVAWRKTGPNPVSRGLRPVSTASAATNSVRIIKTNVLIRPLAFDWRDVESQDYASYVENLRAIGMPEPTIRDIIIADVDQLFARRRRENAARQDIEWWHAEPSAAYQSNVVARAESLVAERNALLNRLLGEDWRKGRIDQQPDPVPLAGPVLGALPDDVKKSVQEIASRLAERVREHGEQRMAAGQPPDAAELARLHEETRQQLAAILNPQQLEEYLLRFSENATQLRRELAGIDTSPDEFRRLFRTVDEIDRTIQLRYNTDDPAARRQRETLEQQRLAALQSALGPDRFNAYQTLHDPLYQEAVAAAQKTGGSPEVASALYEITRLTAEEMARINNDPTLTAAQKQQQLRDAELEQQRARSVVLGETTPAEAAAPVPSPPPLRPHVMEPGETLGQVALRYGVRIGSIREANPGLDINRLPPGSVINVPEREAPQFPPLPPRAR